MGSRAESWEEIGSRSTPGFRWRPGLQTSMVGVVLATRFLHRVLALPVVIANPLLRVVLLSGGYLSGLWIFLRTPDFLPGPSLRLVTWRNRGAVGLLVCHDCIPFLERGSIRLFQRRKRAVRAGMSAVACSGCETGAVGSGRLRLHGRRFDRTSVAASAAVGDGTLGRQVRQLNFSGGRATALAGPEKSRRSRFGTFGKARFARSFYCRRWDSNPHLVSQTGF